MSKSCAFRYVAAISPVPSMTTLVLKNLWGAFDVSSMLPMCTATPWDRASCARRNVVGPGIDSAAASKLLEGPR